MNGGNDLAELGTFPEPVLAEIVREGEMQVQAQLQTSLAADSRALTISGSCLTAATALLGVAAALSKSATPDLPLIVVSGTLGIVLIVSAGLAMYSARPVSFDFPGNDPAKWAPAYWHVKPGPRPSLRRARLDQAKTLQEIIEGNRRAIAKNALFLGVALWFIYGGSLIAGVAVVSILTSRL